MCRAGQAHRCLGGGLGEARRRGAGGAGDAGDGPGGITSGSGGSGEGAQRRLELGGWRLVLWALVFSMIFLYDEEFGCSCLFGNVCKRAKKRTGEGEEIRALSNSNL